MSKDDGIYILATKHPSVENELVYRVVYAFAIDNIYGEMAPSGTPYPNPQMIKEYFGQSIPLATEDDAIQTAMLMLSEHEAPEHGVGVIYAWADQTYQEIIGEHT